MEQKLSYPDVLFSITSGEEPTLEDLVKVGRILDLLRDYLELVRLENMHAVAGYKTARILDFDMIYPCCWPVQLRKPTRFERVCHFPITAAFFFGETQSEFTIPPGTFFELSRYLGLFREKLSRAAGELTKAMATLESMTATRSTRTLGVTKSEIELIDNLPLMASKEIQEFVEAGVTFHALESLLHHQRHLPWAELAQDTGAQIAGEVVDRIWEALNHLRPGFSINNFADSLNISALVALTESGARTSVNSKTRLFPLLATGTSILRKMNVPLHLSSIEPRPYLGEDDQVVAVSPRYLLLDTAMDSYCEHAPRPKQTFVSALLNSIHEARRAWEQCWTRLWKHLPPRQPYASVKMMNFAEQHSFYNLMEKLDNFFHRHFAPILSILESKALTDQQRSETFLGIRKRLLKGLLGGVKLEYLLPREEKLLSAETLGKSSDLIKLFVNILQDRQKIVLTSLTVEALRKNKILQDGAENDIVKDGILQFQPTCIHGRTHLLQWDGDIETGTRQCSWNYTLSLQEILKKFHSFTLAVEDKYGKPKKDCYMKVYGNGSVSSLRWSASLKSTALLDSIIGCVTEPNYVHFEHEIFDFFVELEPFTNESILLEVAVRYENDLNHELSQLHFKSAVTRLDPRVLKEILAVYDSCLSKKREERILSGEDDEHHTV